MKTHPYFTQSGSDREKDGDQYIANMRDGAVAGFKYFAFEGTDNIEVTVRGNAEGAMIISTSKDFKDIAGIANIRVNQGNLTVRTELTKLNGTLPLYFRYEGTGTIDFIRFRLGKNLS